MLLELERFHDHDVFLRSADVDGIVRVRAAHDATLFSLSPNVFREDVFFFDRNRMIVPMHWPLALLAALAGSDTLTFVVARRFETRPRSSDKVDVDVEDVHLFSTLPYRPLLRWLLDDAPAPFMLFDNCLVARASRPFHVVYKGEERTWKDWFALFPRFAYDRMRVHPVHQGQHGFFGRTMDDDEFFICTVTPKRKAHEAALPGTVVCNRARK